MGKLRLTGLAVLGFATTSCTHVGNGWLPGTMSSAANDQIMLVRKDPASFGYLRLQSQSKAYPDLGFFVNKHGVPNFLAETHNHERHYFILYYLKDRKAFACRSKEGRRGAVEFAGPYPITDKEFKLLDGFRRDPSRAPVKL